MAPCIRRFNSLMSKLPVAITLSLQILRPRRARAALGGPSAGDDRPVADAAQNRADRTRLGDREYDDRQRRLAGKREGGCIHHLVTTLDRLRMRQPIETLGGRVLLRIGRVDAVD